MSKAAEERAAQIERVPMQDRDPELSVNEGADLTTPRDNAPVHQVAEPVSDEHAEDSE